MTDIDHLATARELISRGEHRSAQAHALISIAESLREIAFPTLRKIEPTPAEPEPVTVPCLGESERGYEWVDIDGDTWRWHDGRGWRWRDSEGEWFGYERMSGDKSCGPFTRGARVE